MAGWGLQKWGSAWSTGESDGVTVSVAPATSAIKAAVATAIVVLGSITASVTPATAKTVTTAPSTAQGAIAVAPAPASLKQSTVAPTVNYGSATATPVALTFGAGTVAPTVWIGAQTPKVTLLQKKVANFTNALGSVEVVLDSPVAAGSLLVVSVSTTNGGQVAVTDSRGSSYARAFTGVNRGTVTQLDTFYSANVVAGSRTLTISPAQYANVGTCSITVNEFGTIEKTDALAQVAFYSGAAWVGVNTTGQLDGCLVYTAACGGGSPQPNFTLLNTGTNHADDYFVQPVAGLVTAGFTGTGGTRQVMVAVFKPFITPPVSITAGSLKLTTVAPTVGLVGGYTASVTPITAKVATTAPSVVLGNVVVSPAAVTGRLGTIAPQVAQSSQTLTVAPATTKAVGVNPAVVLGTVAVRPTAASTSFSTANAQAHVASMVVSVAPATFGVRTITAGTLLASVTVQPSPVWVICETVPPSIGQAVHADRVHFRLGVVAPAVHLGDVVVGQKTATHRYGTVQPTARLSDVTVTVSSAAAKVGVSTPSVVYGSLVIPTSVIETKLTAVEHETLTSLVLHPHYVDFRIGTRKPMVIGGVPFVAFQLHEVEILPWFTMTGVETQDVLQASTEVEDILKIDSLNIYGGDDVTTD